MLFNRILTSELLKWKTKLDPKPLLVKGARQVGKTSLIKDFGNKYYEQIAYFNFDRQPDLQQFFELTKDPERIIQNLSLVVGFPILPGETLIFFDEIQECKEALNSLKYFEESNLSHHIIGAGSLLGVTLGNAKSFPVGKVDFLDMYPLTFLEFLDAKDKEMHQYLQSIQSIEPIPDYFFNRILESFRLYTICGGLPEVAKELVESNSLERVEELLFAINRAYEYDFSKHVAEKDIQKIAFIWDSIPSQLSKENKKFLYQTVKKGARAREYEDALTWLIQAGLVYKVNRVNKVGIPFSGYDDLSAFKIYLLDMGLLRQKAQLEARSILNPNGLFSEFKGALVENYILQSLSAQFQIKPRYWTSDGIAEIDFLLQFNNELIPIEVKSEENVRSKSLTFYSKTYNPRVKLRFSMRNLINQEELINIPLFLADRTKFFLNQQLH